MRRGGSIPTRRALRRARARAAAAWLFAPTLALAWPAGAAIPVAPKVANAIAEANSSSGRADPLLLEVRMAIPSRPSEDPDALEPLEPMEPTEVWLDGILASHPTGLARLEIRREGGEVERHLLQGNSYIASRDGQLLDDPEPLLPPVFLLQVTSGAALGAALASFGVAEQEIVLGKLDEHDCYVLGGRLLGVASEGRPPLASLWVDVESYDPVRIVRTDGVEYRLGPVAEYDGIRIPRWIEIASPGAVAMRLEIERAAPASAPAAAFGEEWLTAPLPAGPGSDDAPAPPPATGPAAP